MKICVIEDNTIHRNQIVKRLNSEGYENYTIEYSNLSERRGYTIQGCNVVIVDLQLNRTYEQQIGRKLVTNELWPVDRDMWFVVFSQHIIYETQDELIWPRESLQPKIVLVAKEVDNKEQILKKSLDNLINNAIKPLKLILPSKLPLIRANSIEHTRVIRDFKKDLLNSDFGKLGNFSQRLDDYLFRFECSNDLLRELVARLASLARMGDISKKMSMLAYGSYARREATEESDVEFVALVHHMRADNQEPLSGTDIAAIAWNNSVMFCKENKKKAEGERLFQISPDKILAISGTGNNSYAPGISSEKMIEELKDGKDRQYRVRLVQYLTESFVLFNQESFNQQISRMVHAAAGVESKGANEMLQYLLQKKIKYCFDQFETDVSIEEKKSKEKVILGRYFASWSFRIALLRALLSRKKFSDKDLIESITEPPLIRVVNMYLDICEEPLQKSSPYSGLLKEYIQELKKQLALSVIYMLSLWDSLLFDHEDFERHKTEVVEFRKASDKVISLLKEKFDVASSTWMVEPMGSFGIDELKPIDQQ